ncbi:GntR family transcriptional regulator [Niallia sp. 01092]|uniref:GntR family transcriptional regulator n=1 Tax=Niallia sp. 01092 TaxID=3457759 RepID=UPI003FD08654
MIAKKALYKKIYDDIVDKIDSGIYQVNELLPSESELEELFTASRTPVRQALKQLENDGFIYRLQGKGSFVANRKSLRSWQTGFKATYSQEWKKIHTKTISIKKIKSPIKAKLLELSNEEEITHIKRIRTHNGEPVMYLEHFSSPILPFEIFTKDPTYSSLENLLKEELDVEFLKIEEAIEAVEASTQIATLLKIDKSSPVLKITRTSYNSKDDPIDILICYTKTNKWKYVASYETRID